MPDVAMDVLEREVTLKKPEQCDVGARPGLKRPHLALQAEHGGRTGRCRLDDLAQRHSEVDELAEGRRQVERGPVDAELVQVGRDHVGLASGGHDRLRGLEGERPRTVADVHHDARLQARSAASSSRPLSSTIFIVWPVKQCVSTSFGFKKGRTSSIYGGPNGDVHHERQLAFVGRTPGTPERLERIACEGDEVPDPHLDAEHEIAVALDEPTEQIDVQIVDVGALVVVADEADARDVEERRDSDLRRADDELAEPRQRHRAGRARHRSRSSRRCARPQGRGRCPSR